MLNKAGILHYTYKLVLPQNQRIYFIFIGITPHINPIINILLKNCNIQKKRCGCIEKHELLYKLACDVG